MNSNITRKFNSHVEREKFLKSLPFVEQKANAMIRYICIDGWMNHGKECYGFNQIGGLMNPDLMEGFGKIDSIADGVWGYEGDRWAVYINGEAYPSSYVVEASWFTL